MKKLNYSLEFSDSDIVEFERGQENQEEIFRCKVKCKFCSKSVAAKYKKHWIVGNIETHLEQHVLQASIVSNTANTTAQKN